MSASIKILAAIALLGVLVACGGGDADDSYAGLQARAGEAEANAVALIRTGPCSADPQCGAMKFFDAFPSCDQGRYKPYLLQAPDARSAEDWAAEQRDLASKARSLAPPPNLVVCTAHVELPPVPACRRNACELVAWGTTDVTARVAKD